METTSKGARSEVVAAGQKWADKDKRSPHRRVIVERVDKSFVHYRDQWQTALRYRSRAERFVNAFRLCGCDE